MLLLALPACASARAVNTTLGPITGGSSVAASGLRVDHFFGYPFASPPLGNLRFASPQPHPPWSTPRSAVEHGHCCPQGQTVVGSEDCLVLDLYAPASPPSSGRAIMVFFYGGSFFEGCASPYNMTELAAATGNIVVAANYRLHALGFLALPEQLAAGAANWGLQDQQLVLRWVRDNAAAFGGDAEA